MSSGEHYQRKMKEIIDNSRRDAENYDNDKSIKSAYFTNIVEGLEILHEESNRKFQVHELVKDYFIDLKNEYEHLKIIRFCLVIYGFLCSIGTSIAFFWIIIMEPEWFLAIDGRFQIFFLTALLTVSVAPILQMIRLVFQGRADRHKDGLVPENFKQILSAVTS